MSQLSCSVLSSCASGIMGVIKDCCNSVCRVLCITLDINGYVIEIGLLTLSPKYLPAFVKCRCSNHNLHVETGSHFNIPRSDRMCTLCKTNTIWDEYHYVMI